MNIFSFSSKELVSDASSFYIDIIVKLYYYQVTVFSVVSLLTKARYLLGVSIYWLLFIDNHLFLQYTHTMAAKKEKPKALSDQESDFLDLRERCIRAFASCFIHTLALDSECVPSHLRKRILEDSVYKEKTKQLTARFYIDQVANLREIQTNSSFEVDSKTKTNDMLRSTEKLMDFVFKNMNLLANEQNAINIFFEAMDAKAIKDLDITEVKDDGTSTFEYSELEQDTLTQEAQDIYNKKLELIKETYPNLTNPQLQKKLEEIEAMELEESSDG